MVQWEFSRACAVSPLLSEGASYGPSETGGEDTHPSRLKVVGGQGHPLPGPHGTNVFFMPPLLRFYLFI